VIISNGFNRFDLLPAASELHKMSGIGTPRLAARSRWNRLLDSENLPQAYVHSMIGPEATHQLGRVVSPAAPRLAAQIRTASLRMYGLAAVPIVASRAEAGIYQLPRGIRRPVNRRRAAGRHGCAL
jgi:hypothetical protein